MTGQIALTAIMTGLVSLGTGVRWTPPRSVLWWSGRTRLAARPPRPGPWTGLRPRGPLVDGLVTGRIAPTVIMTGLRVLWVEGLVHRLVLGWLGGNRTPLISRPGRRETFLGRRRASSPLWLPGALSLADHLPSGFPLLRWS